MSLQCEAGENSRGVGAEPAVVLSWAALPVAAVIAMGSVLYDGWRQMYFVYPAFVLLAVAGARTTWGVWRDAGSEAWRRFAAGGALLALFVDMAATAAWLIRWHPHQNVYFNLLAGSRAVVPERFEIDYWGLSGRRLLEQLVAHVGRPEILVRGVEASIENSAMLLPRADRLRLRFVGAAEDADYVVTHHRCAAPVANLADEVFTLHVDGMRIGTVFKGRRKGVHDPAVE